MRASFPSSACWSVRHRVRVCFRPHYHNQRFPSSRSIGRLVGHRSAASLSRSPPSILHPEEIERRTNGHRTFIAHSLVRRARPRPSIRPFGVFASSRPSPAPSLAPSLNRGSNNNLKASLTIPHCERDCRIAPQLARKVPPSLSGIAQDRVGSLLTRIVM